MWSFFWSHVSFIDEGISGISLVLSAPKRIPKPSSFTVVNGKHLLATSFCDSSRFFLLRSRYITDYHSIVLNPASSVVELSIDPRSVLISVQRLSNGRCTHGDCFSGYIPWDSSIECLLYPPLKLTWLLAGKSLFFVLGGTSLKGPFCRVSS